MSSVVLSNRTDERTLNTYTVACIKVISDIPSDILYQEEEPILSFVIGDIINTDMDFVVTDEKIFDNTGASYLLGSSAWTKMVPGENNYELKICKSPLTVTPREVWINIRTKNSNGLNFKIKNIQLLISGYESGGITRFHESDANIKTKMDLPRLLKYDYLDNAIYTCFGEKIDFSNIKQLKDMKMGTISILNNYTNAIVDPSGDTDLTFSGSITIKKYLYRSKHVR